MKKVIRVLLLFLAFFSLSFIISCNDDDNVDPITIESISVVSESIPASILTTEIDEKIDDIKIEVKKSDDSIETINLSKSMISAEDLAKLTTAGTYTITVEYEGFKTSLTIVTIQQNSANSDEKKEIPYSVFVKDIAGKPLADFYVIFYLNNELMAEGYTGSNGIYSAELKPNKYEVVIEGREGYYLNQETFETDLMGTQIEITCELDRLDGVEADIYNGYELGDIMYDFTVVDTEGNELRLYELLDNYKAVILNFWYTTCSACYYEFPYMVEAYNSTYKDADDVVHNYSDDIAIIAINPSIAGTGDTIEDIADFKSSMGLTFNVAMDYDFDTTNLTMDPALTTMFAVDAYPTTVVIDSFGLIAQIDVGAITATEKWTQTFDKYLAEDYYPVYTGEIVDEEGYIKPDITQADSSELEIAINGTNHDGTTFNGTYSPEDNKDKDLSWPWIVEEFNDRTCIKPSNKDKNPSFSIVYTTVFLKEGDVFTFDYYSSTEEYDTLYIVVDGSIATAISGQSPDWETSYAFVAIESKEYEIGFCYIKDSSYSVGEDAVFITNVRILQVDNIDKVTYIYRECATGPMNEFTYSYGSYVAVVYNEADGYYHVGTEDGPLLFADMLSGTQWNNSTLYEICLENACIGADGIDYNELIEEYTVYASNSSIGYTPVTKELADALKQVVKKLGHELAANNPNQWLEVCVYYSAYGTNGVELGLPTVGVCPFEPIMFNGDAIEEAATAEATFDRIILPRGFIFGFTPTKSGVYAFYSTEEELETVAWICNLDGIAIDDTDTELRLFAKQSTNNIQVDQNFIVYIYLEEGQLYLFRAAFYDVYEYSTITVEMKYTADTLELLTLASPEPFTSTDDEMSDIVSGNYIDIELREDGYYHVVGSHASDDYIYCDMTYINNITYYPLLECLSSRFNAFDFSRDNFGNKIYDDEGYYRVTGYDEEYNLVRYYVCYNENDEYFYVNEVGADGYTEENGYTYVIFTEEELEKLANADFTEYVTDYVEQNMITDKESELYGCVKVDEKFATVLGLLMDKYTFPDVEYSWAKLCYYYKYLGPVTE